MECKYKEIQFSDKDVVEKDDWIPDGEYNPHNIRPWLFHDHGFVLGICFASCLRDAFDAMVDNDKLDSFTVKEEDLKDYGKTQEEQDNRLAYLGNAGEPFDVECVSVEELPNPKFSFCAMFSASID